MVGSGAWVVQHLGDQAARDRISVYLNDDPGTGKTYGLFLALNLARKRKRYLGPASDLTRDRGTAPMQARDCLDNR